MFSLLQIYRDRPFPKIGDSIYKCRTARHVNVSHCIIFPLSSQTRSFVQIPFFVNEPILGLIAKYPIVTVGTLIV